MIRMGEVRGGALLAVLALWLFSSDVVAESGEYSLELVAPQPSLGFNYPYYLRVPASTSPTTVAVLVVESNNSGVHDEFDRHIEGVRSHATGNGIGPLVAAHLNQPLLIPVFPRSEERWEIYTHALDRDAMLLREDKAERLDLQLLGMVAHARQKLDAAGLEAEEKFVLVGFSASGTFSNRFAFLHPGKLLAVVSGAVNAFPMLPVSRLDGFELRFPLGTADVETLTGRKFQLERWRQLPQFIFMGAADDNDAVQFDDAYSEAERETVFAALGRSMVQRWSTAQAVYLGEQPYVTFVTYGQVGHWTDKRINRDIVNFVKTEIERAAAEDMP